MSVDYILTVFITIVTIVDPLGLIPVYLPIASRFTKAKQRRLVFLSSLIALIVTTSFLFVGKFLFKYLQIDLNSIYIVGGILLFLIGLDMIYARPSRQKSTPEEQEEAVRTLRDLSVFPLAIPMLSGPGTIAAVIMFSSKHESFENYLIVFAAMVAAFFLAAMAMIFSTRLLKVFGQTGINVLDRVMGIILCSLAVQFITNSIVDIVRSI